MDSHGSTLHKVLLKTTEQEHISHVPFDSQRCRFPVATRIADYFWVFDKRKGWLVDSAYLGDEHKEVEALIKDR